MTDLISRQAAIDALDKRFDNIQMDQTTEILLLRRDLRGLPSAQRKGEWIRHKIGHENTPWGFDCSVCGKWLVIGEDTADQCNYCPNCGAKMEKNND